MLAECDSPTPSRTNAQPASPTHTASLQRRRDDESMGNLLRPAGDGAYARRGGQGEEEQEGARQVSACGEDADCVETFAREAGASLVSTTLLRAWYNAASLQFGSGVRNSERADASCRHGEQQARRSAQRDRGAAPCTDCFSDSVTEADTEVVPHRSLR